jgi:hypothetical protein
MINLIRMKKYMFNGENMKKMMMPRALALPHALAAPHALALPHALAAPHTLAVPHALAVPHTLALPVFASAAPIKKSISTKPFTPFQKDKLFWCFFIILNGYEEYEMNHSNSFSLEKQIKIETVEKLKSIKEKLKELKLKRTELEDELVNKQVISLKGLSALCLVHGVSITYIFGRKYCELNPDQAKKGIIIQNEKKEDSLKWTTNENENNNTDFLMKMREDYWFIENIQKPLKAASAYTLPELQDICKKLQIGTMNDKAKAKTKTKLYEEILQTI